MSHCTHLVFVLAPVVIMLKKHLFNCEFGGKFGDAIRLSISEDSFLFMKSDIVSTNVFG